MKKIPDIGYGVMVSVTQMIALDFLWCMNVNVWQEYSSNDIGYGPFWKTFDATLFVALQVPLLCLIYFLFPCTMPSEVDALLVVS